MKEAAHKASVEGSRYCVQDPLKRTIGVMLSDVTPEQYAQLSEQFLLLIRDTPAILK